MKVDGEFLKRYREIEISIDPARIQLIELDSIFTILDD